MGVDVFFCYLRLSDHGPARARARRAAFSCFGVYAEGSGGLPRALAVVIFTAVALASAARSPRCCRKFLPLPSATHFGAQRFTSGRSRAPTISVGFLPRLIDILVLVGRGAVSHRLAAAAGSSLCLGQSLVGADAMSSTTRDRRRDRSSLPFRRHSPMASIRQTATSPSWAYFSIVTRALELALAGADGLGAGATTRGSYRRPAGDPAAAGRGQVYRARAALLFSDTSLVIPCHFLSSVLRSAAVACW